MFFQHFPSPLGISVMLADIIIFPSLKVMYMLRCNVNDKYGQIRCSLSPEAAGSLAAQGHLGLSGGIL